MSKLSDESFRNARDFVNSPSLSLWTVQGVNAHLFYRTFTDGYALSTDGEVYEVDISISKCPLLKDGVVDSNKAEEIKSAIVLSIFRNNQKIPDGFTFLQDFLKTPKAFSLQSIARR